MTEPIVELLAVADCPGARDLLPRLRGILDEHGVATAVHVVEIRSQDEAEAARFLGSPTVRVDGVDVEPDASARSEYGLGCRVYPHADGMRNTPPESWIHDALRVHGGAPTTSLR